LRFLFAKGMLTGMPIKIMIKIGKFLIERIVFIKKDELHNIEQAVDDHASDIISETIEVDYAPVKGN
jgi:hypothetical protein